MSGHRCCSPTCPGLPYRASDIAHPPNCGAAGEGPPALPGEVWRDVVRVRPVEAEIESLCSIAPNPQPWPSGDMTLRAWRWLEHADPLPVLGRWREMFGEAHGVYRAWALAMRARAEKAEAIAAAWAALRDVNLAYEIARNGQEKEAAIGAISMAKAALRALGVDP